MLQIKNRISRLEFNDKKYLRDTERALLKLVKEAAREWLIAVLNEIKGAPHTSGDSFPTQTGEAKGSLLPLATILNQSQIRVDVPITTAPGRPNRISMGRQKGKVRLGKTGARMIFNFEFSTGVLHFIINEQYFSDIPASDTPWDVRLAGQRAFENFLDENAPERIPRISSYLFSKQVP